MIKKKIVLINQSTGPLFIDICNAYSRKYSEVILITGNILPTYAELDEKVNVVRKKKYNALRIHRRLYTWFVFFLQSMYYLIFSSGIDRILFVSNPPFLPFLGYFFSRIKKFEYDVLIYDIYPDAFLSLGYCTEKAVVYRIWEFLNRKTYQHANRVFTISEVMKNIISKSSVQTQVEVVYPWVDNSFIMPQNKSGNWFIKRHNLMDRKVVLYSGNMANNSSFTGIEDAAKFYNSQYEIINKAVFYSCLLIGFLTFLYSYRSITSTYKARNNIEGFIFTLLLFSACIAILVTAGILLSVLFEAIRFFEVINISDF